MTTKTATIWSKYGAIKDSCVFPKKEDIKIINCPVGMPGRAIDGLFIRKVESGSETPKSCPYHCIRTCDYSKSPYCIILALYNAAKGNMEKGYAFAGVNAHLAKKIISVKETIASLKAEFSQAKQLVL